MLKLRTATQRKLAMAEYYMRRMKDTQNNLDAFDFECELESFLAHSGSITNLPRPYNKNWFMEQEYGQKKGYRDWYDEKVLELQSDEIMQFLRNQRNIVIHFKMQTIHTISTAEVGFIENLAASSSSEVTSVNVVDGIEETFESPPKIIQPVQPGQSHLNSGTEVGSWVRSMRFKMARIIDALRKPFKKLDAIALPAQPTEFTFKRIWEFKTNELTGSKEVIPVCEKYLETLKRLVEECHAKGF